MTEHTDENNSALSVLSNDATLQHNNMEERDLILSTEETQLPLSMLKLTRHYKLQEGQLNKITSKNSTALEFQSNFHHHYIEKENLSENIPNQRTRTEDLNDSNAVSNRPNENTIPLMLRHHKHIKGGANLLPKKSYHTGTKVINSNASNIYRNEVDDTHEDVIDLLFRANNPELQRFVIASNTIEQSHLSHDIQKRKEKRRLRLQIAADKLRKMQKKEAIAEYETESRRLRLQVLSAGIRKYNKSKVAKKLSPRNGNRSLIRPRQKKVEEEVVMTRKPPVPRLSGQKRMSGRIKAKKYDRNFNNETEDKDMHVENLVHSEDQKDATCDTEIHNELADSIKCDRKKQKKTKQLDRSHLDEVVPNHEPVSEEVIERRAIAREYMQMKRRNRLEQAMREKEISEQREIDRRRKLQELELTRLKKLKKSVRPNHHPNENHSRFKDGKQISNATKKRLIREQSKQARQVRRKSKNINHQENTKGPNTYEQIHHLSHLDSQLPSTNLDDVVLQAIADYEVTKMPESQRADLEPSAINYTSEEACSTKEHFSIMEGNFDTLEEESKAISDYSPIDQGFESVGSDENDELIEEVSPLQRKETVLCNYDMENDSHNEIKIYPMYDLQSRDIEQIEAVHPISAYPDIMSNDGVLESASISSDNRPLLQDDFKAENENLGVVRHTNINRDTTSNSGVESVETDINYYNNFYHRYCKTSPVSNRVVAEVKMQTLLLKKKDDDEKLRLQLLLQESDDSLSVIDLFAKRMYFQQQKEKENAIHAKEATLVKSIKVELDETKNLHANPQQSQSLESPNIEKPVSNDDSFEIPFHYHKLEDILSDVYHDQELAETVLHQEEVNDTSERRNDVQDKESIAEATHGSNAHKKPTFWRNMLTQHRTGTTHDFESNDVELSHLYGENRCIPERSSRRVTIDVSELTQQRWDQESTNRNDSKQLRCYSPQTLSKRLLAVVEFNETVSKAQEELNHLESQVAIRQLQSESLSIMQELHDEVDSNLQIQRLKHNYTTLESKFNGDFAELTTELVQNANYEIQNLKAEQLKQALKEELLAEIQQLSNGKFQVSRTTNLANCGNNPTETSVEPRSSRSTTENNFDTPSTHEHEIAHESYSESYETEGDVTRHELSSIELHRQHCETAISDERQDEEVSTIIESDAVIGHDDDDSNWQEELTINEIAESANITDAVADGKVQVKLNIDDQRDEGINETAGDGSEILSVIDVDEEGAPERSLEDSFQGLDKSNGASDADNEFYDDENIDVPKEVEEDGYILDEVKISSSIDDVSYSKEYVVEDNDHALLSTVNETTESSSKIVHDSQLEEYEKTRDQDMEICLKRSISVDIAKRSKKYSLNNPTMSDYKGDEFETVSPIHEKTMHQNVRQFQCSGTPNGIDATLLLSSGNVKTGIEVPRDTILDQNYEKQLKVRLVSENKILNMKLEALKVKIEKEIQSVVEQIKYLNGDTQHIEMNILKQKKKVLELRLQGHSAQVQSQIAMNSARYYDDLLQFQSLNFRVDKEALRFDKVTALTDKHDLVICSPHSKKIPQNNGNEYSLEPKEDQMENEYINDDFLSESDTHENTKIFSNMLASDIGVNIEKSNTTRYIMSNIQTIDISNSISKFVTSNGTASDKSEGTVDEIKSTYSDINTSDNSQNTVKNIEHAEIEEEGDYELESEENNNSENMGVLEKQNFIVADGSDNFSSGTDINYDSKEKIDDNVVDNAMEVDEVDDYGDESFISSIVEQNDVTNDGTDKLSSATTYIDSGISKIQEKMVEKIVDKSMEVEEVNEYSDESFISSIAEQDDVSNDENDKLSSATTYINNDDSKIQEKIDDIIVDNAKEVEEVNEYSGESLISNAVEHKDVDYVTENAIETNDINDSQSFVDDKSQSPLEEVSSTTNALLIQLASYADNKYIPNKCDKLDRKKAAALELINKKDKRVKDELEAYRQHEVEIVVQALAEHALARDETTLNIEIMTGKEKINLELKEEVAVLEKIYPSLVGIGSKLRDGVLHTKIHSDKCNAPSSILPNDAEGAVLSENDQHISALDDGYENELFSDGDKAHSNGSIDGYDNESFIDDDNASSNGSIDHSIEDIAEINVEIVIPSKSNRQEDGMTQESEYYEELKRPEKPNNSQAYELDSVLDNEAAQSLESNSDLRDEPHRNIESSICTEEEEVQVIELSINAEDDIVQAIEPSEKVDDETAQSSRQTNEWNNEVNDEASQLADSNSITGNEYGQVTEASIDEKDRSIEVVEESKDGKDISRQSFESNDANNANGGSAENYELVDDYESDFGSEDAVVHTCEASNAFHDVETDFDLGENLSEDKVHYDKSSIQTSEYDLKDEIDLDNKLSAHPLNINPGQSVTQSRSLAAYTSIVRVDIEKSQSPLQNQAMKTGGYEDEILVTDYEKAYSEIKLPKDKVSIVSIRNNDSQTQLLQLAKDNVVPREEGVCLDKDFYRSSASYHDIDQRGSISNQSYSDNTRDLKQTMYTTQYESGCPDFILADNSQDCEFSPPAISPALNSLTESSQLEDPKLTQSLEEQIKRLDSLRATLHEKKQVMIDVKCQIAKEKFKTNLLEEEKRVLREISVLENDIQGYRDEYAFIQQKNEVIREYPTKLTHLTHQNFYGHVVHGRDLLLLFGCDEIEIAEVVDLRTDDLLLDYHYVEQVELVERVDHNMILRFNTEKCRNEASRFDDITPNTYETLEDKAGHIFSKIVNKPSNPLNYDENSEIEVPRILRVDDEEVYHNEYAQKDNLGNVPIEQDIVKEKAQNASIDHGEEVIDKVISTENKVTFQIAIDTQDYPDYTISCIEMHDSFDSLRMDVDVAQPQIYKVSDTLSEESSFKSHDNNCDLKLTQAVEMVEVDKAKNKKIPLNDSLEGLKEENSCSIVSGQCNIVEQSFRAKISEPDIYSESINSSQVNTPQTDLLLELKASSPKMMNNGLQADNIIKNNGTQELDCHESKLLHLSTQHNETSLADTTECPMIEIEMDLSQGYSIIPPVPEYVDLVTDLIWKDVFDQSFRNTLNTDRLDPTVILSKKPAVTDCDNVDMKLPLPRNFTSSYSAKEVLIDNICQCIYQDTFQEIISESRLKYHTAKIRNIAHLIFNEVFIEVIQCHANNYDQDNDVRLIQSLPNDEPL